MKQPLAIGLLSAALLLAPFSAFASTLEAGRTIVLSEASSTNAYLTGTDITVVTPLVGDLLAAGGTIAANGPIGGDAMLAGGTIDIEKPVTGDVRVAGGRITINAPIGGDLIAAGANITASTTATDTRIAGGTVSLTGAKGPVVIYGSDITLAGDFSGDVTVEASNSITLADGTHIHGAFRYNAPQQFTPPATVILDHGSTYVGSSTFLPTSKQAHTFAIAGATILFIVHLLAVLILAGIIAGLFPQFTERIAERALGNSIGRFALLALLGFAVLVATPFLIFILLASFVGIGVALIILALYALFFILSYVYAGILAGAALSRRFMKRYVITWKEAVFGMLVFYLVGVVPVLGFLVKAVLMLAAGGVLVTVCYAFAFRRPQEELPLE